MDALEKLKDEKDDNIILLDDEYEFQSPSGDAQADDRQPPVGTENPVARSSYNDQYGFYQNQEQIVEKSECHT